MQIGVQMKLDFQISRRLYGNVIPRIYRTVQAKLNRSVFRDGPKSSGTPRCTIISSEQPIDTSFSQSATPVDIFTAPSLNSVGTLARSGAKWSLALLVVRQVIGFWAVAVIARILSPADFGLVAMVTTLTSFLMLVSDMGLSWATVQAPCLDHRRVSSLFWIGAILGLTTWGICVLVAPLLAEFFGNKKLILISAAMGVNLFLSSLAVQPLALLKRRMRQKEFSLLQTISSATGAVSGIVAALRGMGYWSLVVQSITTLLLTFLLSMWHSGFVPGKPALSVNMMSLLQFGGCVGACNIVTFFQVNIDNVLIGRYCGEAELGYYSRACFLRTLPAMYAAIALADIMVPALSALREDPARLAGAYRQAIRTIAFVGCPLGVLLGVNAAELVRIIYGPAWAPVTSILIWLSFPATVLPLSTTMGWLFLATGHPREMLLQTLVTTPIVAIVFYFAVGWGGGGVAAASAVLFTVPLPLLQLAYAHRVAEIPLRGTIRAVSPVLLASLLAAMGGYASGQFASLFGVGSSGVFVIKSVLIVLIFCGVAGRFARPLPVARFERVVREWEMRLFVS